MRIANPKAARMIDKKPIHLELSRRDLMMATAATATLAATGRAVAEPVGEQEGPEIARASSF